MKIEKRGQWMAFIVAIAGIGGAITVGLNGEPLLGVAIGGMPLAAIVAAFITGRKSK